MTAVKFLSADPRRGFLRGFEFWSARIRVRGHPSDLLPQKTTNKSVVQWVYINHCREIRQYYMKAKKNYLCKATSII